MVVRMQCKATGCLCDVKLTVKLKPREGPDKRGTNASEARLFAYRERPSVTRASMRMLLGGGTFATHPMCSVEAESGSAGSLSLSSISCHETLGASLATSLRAGSAMATAVSEGDRGEPSHAF